LKANSRSREDPVNRDIIQIPREGGRGWKIGVDLQKHLSQSQVVKHLVDFSVANVTVGIEHDNDLLASLDPFPDFLGEVVEESAARAPIIVLIVKIVDLLAVGTQRAIG
jgi:hypothetical protein